MRLWVFSDLHLTDPQSSFYRSFLKILDEPQSEHDVVVFAGDIFDLMVGKSHYFAEKHADFFSRVKTLASKGVQLYYIEGNHDFHLQSQFQGIPITFENEAVQLKAETPSGTKLIYIAHGDLVDESDVWYLRLRKLFRSMPIEFLADRAPGFLVEKIGESLARSYEQKEGQLPESWPAERRDRLRSTFRRFAEQKRAQGFDYVILGHCHDFDEIPPFYFNMGFPPVHEMFLFYDSLEDCVKRKSLGK